MSAAIGAVLDRLSPTQRLAWQCAQGGELLLRFLCGRQAGKTFWIAVWLLVGALTVANSVNVYLALTKESAKNIIWKELVKVGTELGIDESCFREHGATVKLPNGSVVLVMGTDDRRTIETWRGTKLNKIAIDEMGVQPPEWIGYMVRDILWWSIMTFQGAIVLSGTPGLIANGYWWEQTRPTVQNDAAFFHWTAHENPAIPHVEAFLRATLEKFVWTEETPQFVREFLGRWVHDKDALVYPFDESINVLAKLPKINEVGGSVSWRYVLAQNIGTLDTSAWVMLAWASQWPGAVVVHAELEKLDPYAAAERTRELLAKHRGCDYVIDAGALGASHAEVIRARHHLGGFVSDHNERFSAVRDLRGGLQAGRIKVLEGPATEVLRSQWGVIGWDPRRRWHDPNQPWDAAACAAIHGYSRVPPHSRELVAPKTLSPQEQFLEEVERRLIRECRTREAKARRPMPFARRPVR